MSKVELSKENRLLTDVYKITKVNGSTKNLKRPCQDGFVDVLQKGPASEMTKGPKTKERSSNNKPTSYHVERSPLKYDANSVTPVAVRETRRKNFLGKRRSLRLRRTPQKDQGLDAVLQSPVSSSCSPSPKFPIVRSPMGSASPMLCSSPGRNHHSSQDSSQEVIWNCASPINYQPSLSSQDSSKVREFCQRLDVACSKVKSKEPSQPKTLLEVWQTHPSKRLPASDKKKIERQATSRRKSSNSASEEIKDLLGMIECYNTRNRRKPSPDHSKTPTNDRDTSANSSIEELWGEEDESLTFLASQALFEDTYCDDSKPVTPRKCRFLNTTSKNNSSLLSTPVSQQTSKNESKDDCDELWDDDDDAELFSQEILTLLEQNMTNAEASVVHRCTPEEILMKRQEAIKKRAQHGNVWNGRLRVTQK